MPHDFPLSRFALQCGVTVDHLHVRYEVHGKLSAARDNAILFPTWFAGRHAANSWIIGPGRGLDTTRYCVVVVDALGNGESASPSNHPTLANDGDPLRITILDNVRAQRALLSALGIERLHAVVGRSMGAQHALQWSCTYPQAVGRTVAFCGLPRTTEHNKLLLQPIIDVLAQGLDNGRHAQALDTAAAIYAAWTASHPFFNNGLWKATAPSAKQWCVDHVAGTFRQFHPADLLCLARTWQDADISRNAQFGGDLEAALRCINAPVLLIPISHDLIFRPQDFVDVERAIAQARTCVLDSEWGHRAGAPGGSAEDIQTLEKALHDFLTPALSATSLVLTRCP